MNNENNKKRLTLYYSLLVTIICIIGVSFAWFRLYLSQSNNNTISTRNCFDTTLTEENSKIELTDAFPISDEDGLKQTPFTFTLKNNCSGYVKAYITIYSTNRTSTDASYLKDDYLKVNISPKGTTKNSSLILGKQSLTNLEADKEGYMIIDTGLNANEEKSYDLRIWMDSETSLEAGLSKNWAGKIVVITSAAIPTLKDSILADNEVVEPLTTPGSEVSAHILDDVESTTSDVASTYQAYYVTYGTGWTANGTKFNLTGAAVTSDTYANSYSSLVGKYIPFIPFQNSGSSTAGTMQRTTYLSCVYYVVSATSSGFIYKPLCSTKNTTEAILASTEDDYGTSYYYRGTVKNNYVQFANKCWRIVRITGDGSVKLVLHNDNVSNKANPCSSSNNSTSAAFARYSENSSLTAFNNVNNSQLKDNAYVGFMYGTVSASDYASTHANTNKSTILINLETWYKNNLIEYESKLADTIWCNDKSTFTTYTNGSTYGTGLGYGTNKTGYGAYNRLSEGGDSLYASPSLICPNDNNSGKLSKFTVSDTTNGNGDLTYKIGLLTADEIAFSGSIGYTFNRSTYLQENTGGNSWWTMSPYDFDGNGTYVWQVFSGYLDYYRVSYSIGLRPAIALTSSTTISGGTGTSEDPYIVQ